MTTMRNSRPISGHLSISLDQSAAILNVVISRAFRQMWSDRCWV